MKRLEKDEIKFIKKSAKTGLSLNSLVKLTSLPKSTIYYHVKNYVKKMSNVDLRNFSDWESGYIVGLFVSDGHLSFVKRNYLYRVTFSLNNITEVNIVENLIKMLYKANIKCHTTIYRNTRRVVCTSKTLYKFLESFVIYKKINGLNKKFAIRNIENYNNDFKFGFIGAYIDGDGHIGRDRIKYKRVLIGTSRPRIAEQIKSILNTLSIKNTIQNDRSKNMYIIRISTPFYEKFSNKLNCVKGR